MSVEIVSSKPFAKMITPEEAKKFHEEFNKEEVSLAYWKMRARINRLCSVCESEPVWRWGMGDLCFTCTTGEADPGDDYEIAYDGGS